MTNHRKLHLAVSTALGFTALISSPILAQDEQSADDSDLTLEEVIVTGSRIISENGFGRTSPVTVVGMDEISSYGLTRVEDILNSLPQIETSQNAFISNGATGTAAIDLRGLGAIRTLVLINGRRMQPSINEAADVNQIPASMIERVEVLTGGASATYGADAVAGVVNFIMRRVDGVEISAGISGYQHDNRNDYIQDLMDQRGFTYPTGNTGIDGQAYNVDIVIGGEFADGRGNATAYASWRKNKELLQGERDYTSCALNAAGNWCGGSANAVVPNFYIFPIDDDGNLVFNYDNVFFTLQSDSSLAPWRGNVYNYAPINFFQRPDERWSAGAFVDYELNEHAIAYLETGYSYDETRAQIAESGTFFVEAYPLPITNALFPDAFVASLQQYFPGEDEFGIYIGKRNTEGGPRSNIITNSSFRIVGGVKGAISNDWDYDVSYLHAQTASGSAYINDFLAPSIYTAVNAELCAVTVGCIPYEVFTYQGVTPEQAAGLGGTAVHQNKTSTSVFNAYVTGDTGWGLSAGDIIAVFGYEWREQTYEGISDTLYEDGLLLGQGGEWPSIAGGYRVNELFSEFNIPLLADKPWVEQMTLDLAYRWSDYSTSGSTNTYRVGLDWQVIDALRIRTGYNRAVRAPNISELFWEQSNGLWRGVDPCASATPEYSFEQCARTGMTAEQYGRTDLSPASQYNALYGGNLELMPEKADTITLGVVVDAGDTMRFSFDYWDIRIEDVIGSIPSELTIRQCAEYNSLCDLIIRSGNGSLWLGSGLVVSTHINLGERHWRGIDAAWTWQPGNHWQFDLIGTYMLKKETTPVPNDPNSAYDCVGLTNNLCYPTPKWRHTFTGTYDSNSFWAVTGRWRYFAKVSYDGTLDQIANDNMGAQNYLDLNAVFRFMETQDVTVGVNNILDRELPLAGSTVTRGLGFYDTLGRFLYARVTFRW